MKLTLANTLLIKVFKTYNFSSFLSDLYFARTLSQVLGNGLVRTEEQKLENPRGV